MAREPKSWEVVLITHSKTYRGSITPLPSPFDARTISILNYQNTINTQGEIIPKNYIKLSNVTVTNRYGPLYDHDKLIVKKTDIVMAYDAFDKMGNDNERKRKSKSEKNGSSTIEILTQTIGFSTCYRIFGNVSNFETKLENDQFIPFSNVSLEKIVTIPDISYSGRAFKESYKVHKALPIKLPFLALNKDYIQAYSQKL